MDHVVDILEAISVTLKGFSLVVILSVQSFHLVLQRISLVGHASKLTT